MTAACSKLHGIFNSDGASHHRGLRKVALCHKQSVLNIQDNTCCQAATDNDTASETYQTAIHHKVCQIITLAIATAGAVLSLPTP